MFRSAMALVPAALLFVAACSSSKGNGQPTPPDPDSGAGGSVGQCKLPDVPVAGTTGDGTSGYTIKVLEAVPARPSLTQVNKWTLVVTGADGKPVDGLTIDANCGMTRHSHNCGGTGPKFSDTCNGQYEMSSLIFTMHGDWYITFDLSDADGGPMDSVTLTFCVP